MAVDIIARAMATEALHQSDSGKHKVKYVYVGEVDGESMPDIGIEELLVMVMEDESEPIIIDNVNAYLTMYRFKYVYVDANLRDILLVFECEFIDTDGTRKRGSWKIGQYTPWFYEKVSIDIPTDIPNGDTEAY